MRVLELAMYSPDFLGSFGDSLLALGRELKKNDDFIVVCFPELKDWMHNFELDGFPVTTLPIKNIFDLHTGKKLSTLIKKYKIDIIHTHFGLETQVIACMAKFISSQKVKIIWHWRSPPHTDALLLDVGAYCNTPLRIKRTIGNMGYRFLDTTCVSANIVVSEELQNILHKRRIRNVNVIYNAVDLDKYNPQIVESLPSVILNKVKNLHCSYQADNSAFSIQHSALPLIGNISNFEAPKDHFTFLKAAKIVLQKEPGVKFLLVGGGPTRPKVEAYSQELGISNSILFAGIQADVRQFIYSCNFIVLSSFHEGFPNVICESMALEKPVVATDVGGISEIVRDGENGFLVPRKNPTIMAEKILYLIEHPEQVATLGKNGRKLVEQRFSTQRWAKEIREVFLEIL